MYSDLHFASRRAIGKTQCDDRDHSHHMDAASFHNRGILLWNVLRPVVAGDRSGVGDRRKRNRDDDPFILDVLHGPFVSPVQHVLLSICACDDSQWNSTSRADFLVVTVSIDCPKKRGGIFLGIVEPGDPVFDPQSGAIPAGLRSITS